MNFLSIHLQILEASSDRTLEEPIICQATWHTFEGTWFKIIPVFVPA